MEGPTMVNASASVPGPLKPPLSYVALGSNAANGPTPGAPGKDYSIDMEPSNQLLDMLNSHSDGAIQNNDNGIDMESSNQLLDMLNSKNNTNNNSYGDMYISL